MLPSSVDARAKMKITLGHAELLPSWSSSRVKPPWRTSRLPTPASTATSMGASTGAAATRAAQREMMARNFILEILAGTGSSLESTVPERRMTCFPSLERGNRGVRTERELESDEKEIHCIQRWILETIYLIFDSLLNLQVR